MKKIFSIILAIYFLTTSVGFGVSTHYCHGKAIKTELQLTEQTISCGMVMQVTSCQTPNSSFQKKACCENDFQSYQLTPEFCVEHEVFLFSPVFVNSFFYVFLLAKIPADSKNIFLAHSPPLVYKDLTILYRNFRI